MRQRNEAGDSLCGVSALLEFQVGVMYLFHVVKIEVDGALMMGGRKTPGGIGGR